MAENLYEREFKNIIIRMPNWIGDLVMATPVLQAVKERYPQGKVTVLCASQLKPLLQGNPYVDEIMEFKKPSGWVHRIYHFELIQCLQQGQYDLGILLTNSFSSAWWFWMGGVDYRLGYRGHYRAYLLSLALPYPKELQTQHLVKTYLDLLTPLGYKSEQPCHTQLFLQPEEKAAAFHLLKQDWDLKEDDFIIGINPGATYGSAKCWPPERFRQLTEHLLLNPHAHVCFFGDTKTASLVQEICQGLPKRVLNLAAKTNLRQLMALIEQCTVFVTNDSGPMHIASALNVPLVALFGSTSPIKTGPYDGGKVMQHKVECSPCYKRECPIDFRCMKGIEVHQVLYEIKRLLKAQSIEL